MKILRVFYLYIIISLLCCLPLQAQEDRELQPYEKVVEMIDLGKGFWLLKFEDGSKAKVWFELGDKIDVRVVANVFSTQEKGYIYEYTLFSSKKSMQDVWVFAVIVSSEKLIKDIQIPSGWYEPYVIPVGLSAVPCWGKVAQVDWRAPEGVKIKPGSSTTGFRFTSLNSLPGIVDYYAEGYTPIPKSFWREVDYIPTYDDHTPYGPGVVGKTIGPVPIPDVFKPVNFLNNIIRLKEEAVSLGWIKERGIAQSLNAKLKNARAALQRNQIKTTKNILNALLNELEAQKDKHITSEAYGILRFNVEYLRDRL